MRLGWMGFAALALGASVYATAQSAPKAELTGMAHVAIRVANMDDELAFLAKLGFEKSAAITRNGKVSFYFVKVNDRAFLEIHPTVTSSGQVNPLGFYHICFETNDANALYAQWKAAGLNPTPVGDGPDKTAEFGASDPEGRLTEALTYTPESDPMKDLGKHLGAARVSTVLMGVDLPVADVAAQRKFFEAAGLTSKVEGENVSMSAAGHPQIHVMIRPAKEGVKPKYVFQIDDLDKVTAAVTAAGLKPGRTQRGVTVLDPDGNLFLFLKLDSQ